MFSPGCKDRIKYPKGTRHGQPQRYWLELNVEIALPSLEAYAEYTATEYRHDILSIKQVLLRIQGLKHIL